jgi:membrane protease YdiL (CAAX protease family)
MESVVERASPEASGSPEGGEPQPRWPAWYGGVAFVVALVATLVAVGLVAAATGTTPDDESPTFTIVATFLQDAIFVATAVLFASFVLRPRPGHFGLRATRLWPAVRLAGLGLLSFYGFSALYAVALHPDLDQRITQDLGANTGTLGLIVAGVMVICVAPAAEEFFFRGFFYKALRSRFRVVPAAVIDGIVFGVIHYDFSAADALLVVPPLAVLGFIFCLVYEQTGSLYPVIALHAINNSVAYAIQADGGAVSAVLGPLVVVACMVVPWLAPRPATTLR